MFQTDRSIWFPLLVVLGSVFLALGLYVYQWQPLQQAEYYTMDWRARLGKKTPIDPRLVFLGFNPNHSERFMGASKHSRALRLMKDSWPWSRAVWGLAAERLREAGADVVLLDLLLEKSRRGDTVLNQELRNHPDDVVIGSRLDYQTFAGTQMASYIPPADSVLSQAGPLAAATDTGPVGHVNIWPDEDGVVRSMDYVFNYQGQGLYSLAARGLQKSGHAEDVPDTGPVMFRFGPVGANGYRMYPFYQIFVPSIWEESFGSGEFFEDKIVLVGPYGNWQHDVHRTPMSEEPIPGPVIHLNAIAAALQGNFLTYTARSTDLMLIVGMGVLALIFCFAIRHILLRTLSVILLNLGFLAASLIAYNEWGLYVLTVAPLIPVNVSIPTVFLYDFIQEQREKMRVRGTLDRYISEDVASEILDNRDDYYESLGGIDRDVTVLFSDIRSFTTLSERLEPNELVSQLNDYLTEMVNEVQENRGRLDKFIGDAVMAVWGDLFQNDSTEQDAKLAVNAARNMLEDLEELNEQWESEDRPPFRIGIGIAHGKATFGNLGSNQRMQLTVIGDTVNLAARLEGMTKKYGCELLVSERVANLIEDEYVLRIVDNVRVKGKTEPTSVYTVVQRVDELANGRPDWLRVYEGAFELYQARDFERARDRFQSVLEDRPEDPLCEIYVDRCEEYIEAGPGEDWDGVFEMKTK